MPLDAVIHQPTRLHIMAALFRNRQMSFTQLRDALELTPGNLGSHLAKLEEARYVKGGRVLIDFTFELHYRLTEEGADAFRCYLVALRALLAQMPEPREGDAVGSREEAQARPAP